MLAMTSPIWLCRGVLRLGRSLYLAGLLVQSLVSFWVAHASEPHCISEINAVPAHAQMIACLSDQHSKRGTVHEIPLS